MDAREAQELLEGDSELARVVTESEQRAHVRRDRLVSALLQDRGVLRLISAPHGFGKTMLAWEYATRMFKGMRVAWIDAAKPGFLRDLDSFGFAAFPDAESQPDLVVVDGLPFLDEDRSHRLSQRIDTLLYRGIEVVVTCIPSHDSLRSAQPDRILLQGSDLLVGEREAAPLHLGAESAELRVRGRQSWQRAQRRLLGRVPAVFWSYDDGTLGSCLHAFFSEDLPFEVLAAAFGMLLLGDGTLDDLAALLQGAHPECLRLFADDYPFVDIDMVQGSFHAGEFDMGALRIAVDRCPLAERLLTGTFPLPERALRVLMRHEKIERANGVLAHFCPDERCGAWLREHGWDLLDRGELDLVEALFGRYEHCGPHDDAVLEAMRAWASGLQGSWREADRFAQRVLRRAAPGPDDDPQERLARVAAYLALVAFGDGGPLVFSKEGFSGGDCAASPEEFLAAVIDSCTAVEIARALSMDDAQRAALLEKSRSDPSADRVSALKTMFTEVGDRFFPSMFYQVALHILGFVDSTELRALQQELGCDVVILARRRGLSRTSEALLMRDLWKGGYFGPLGKAGDKRDAALLEAASQRLKQFGEHAGYAVKVPWEVGGVLGSALHPDRGAQRAQAAAEDTPLIEVRLFGGFEVVMGGTYIPDAAWRKKARILFITLVLNQGREVSRLELFDMLWPDVERSKALDSFYTLWSNLQAVFGGDCPHFERKGEFCRINPRYVVSDVAEFEQIARSLLIEGRDTQTLLDTYARLEGLYCGGLLPTERGMPIVERFRERYHAQFTDAMVAAVARSLKAGDARIALWFARRAMEVEQHREDVYNALIRAQVAAGQRCSAIRTYFKCVEFLREDLGLDPSLETQDLYQRLITVDPSLMELSPSSFGNWE